MTQLAITTRCDGPLTPQEIRQRLGFEPWEEYAAKVRLAAPKARRSPERATGRSTRMLCDAAALLQYGARVLLVANTARLARGMQKKLVAMACTLAIHPAHVEACSIEKLNDRLEQYRGGIAPAVFVDHTAFRS